MNLDGWGITGLVFDYAMIIALSGSTALLFGYLWYKGRLHFDETPKYEMLHEENKDE